MIILVFMCKKCNRKIEAFSDEPLPKCPDCNEKLFPKSIRPVNQLDLAIRNNSTPALRIGA